MPAVHSTPRANGLETDVLAALRAAGYEPGKLRAKVVVLGNSGVGKSVLIAAAMGTPDVVEHAVSATAVTRDIERLVLPSLSDGHQVFGDVLVYNIPGLIEAGEAHLAHNKACLKKALTEFPELPTALVYVLSAATGGRVQEGCIVGLRAVLEYVTGTSQQRLAADFRNPDAIVAAVNQIPNRRDATPASEAASLVEYATRVKEVGHLAESTTVFCVRRCSNEDDLYTAGSAGFRGMSAIARAMMLQACTKAQRLRIPASREVRLDKDHVAAEVARVRAEFEAQAKAMRAQSEQQQREHAALMAQLSSAIAEARAAAAAAAAAAVTMPPISLSFGGGGGGGGGGQGGGGGCFGGGRGGSTGAARAGPSFDQAFAAARREHGGPGGTFTWNGNKFHTGLAGE